MLTPLLGHVGQPLAPHDLWTAWNLEPLVVISLFVAGWAYRKGRQSVPESRRRVRERVFFMAGLATVGLALLSPIEALAGVLVSGHMLQHLILILVAAPLIVLGNPNTMMRGLPRDVRKKTGEWRRRLGLTPSRFRWLRHPIAIFLASAGAIWFWHASVPYELAATNELAHGVEHISFLLTALLFWAAVLPGGQIRTMAPGGGVLLIFAVAMQGVILSALLTFADQPWYPSYREAALAWGVDPLDDQRLAGLIMWIPSGLIYTAAALGSLVVWIDRSGAPGPMRPDADA